MKETAQVQKQLEEEAEQQHTYLDDAWSIGWCEYLLYL
jgi:hypothetical protein